MVKLMDLVVPKQATSLLRQPQPSYLPAQSPPATPVVPLQPLFITTSSPQESVSPSIPTPAPNPEPTASPSPTPSPTPSPVPTPNPVPKPTATPTLTPGSAPGSVSAFLGQLASSDRSSEPSDPSVSPSLFVNPQLFFDSGLTVNQAKLKPDILRATWIAGKTPVQVYVEILVVQGQSNNFQVFERGNYGQGTVYEVKQSDRTWYFNLVPTKNTEGTAIVVWQHDPSQPLH